LFLGWLVFKDGFVGGKGAIESDRLLIIIIIIIIIIIWVYLPDYDLI